MNVWEAIGWSDPDRRDEALGRAARRLGETDLLLTKRERTTLECLSHGLTQHMTAEMLIVSPHTIESRLKLAKLKLGAKNTTHAVALALRQGLIS